MRTSEVAAEAGVNIQTLRYYERRGLLPRPARTASGYRVYSPDAVRLIRFIKRAQELGFTLHETEELLRLQDSGGESCAEVSAAAQVKLGDIEARIASLQAIKRALRILLTCCARNQSELRCPILDALDAAASRPGRKMRRRT